MILLRETVPSTRATIILRVSTMSQFSFWRKSLVGAVLVTAAAAAYAVDVNGRIRGTVTDPAGAVIPNAQVVATNQASGVKFTTTSQANGGYSFQQLPIGTYNITASAPGFKGFSAVGIGVNIDQEYIEPVQLQVGGSTETVEVQADAVQVNTTDMQLNNIVNAKQIIEYPLLGRAFTDLELILPGVQAPNDRFGGFSVNGSETQQSSYLINGADVNDFALNTIAIEPNVDALSEFNLITGPLNAEYSRNSGAIVSSVVKQGTNHFHGDAFEFYRDTFLNTPGFFNYSTVKNANGTLTGVKTTPVYHQNIFGGTIGGPVLRDKLFFFGAYQGTRARRPQTSPSNIGNTVVPTAAQRAGNFAGATFSKNVIPGTLKIPGCVSGVDTFATCFGANGGQLPTSAFNPISVALLTKYVPLPNSGTNNFVFNPTTTVKENQYIGRIDFSLNPKNQFDFVGIYQKRPTSDTSPFTGPTLPGFGDTSTSKIYEYTFDYTRQISSTALNLFSLHYLRFNFNAVLPTTPVAPSSAGFAITPQNTAGESLPLITLTSGFAIGFSTNGPQPRIDQNYQIDDSFSKVIGRHSLKFGYDGRKFSVDNEFSGSNNGSYGFNATHDKNFVYTNKNSSGNVFLDYLLGNPNSYNQGAGGRISAQSYEHYLYGQDTWKVTDNLTLDYGLGWQLDTPIHNKQDGGEGVNCFVPGQQSKIFPSAPLSLNFPGDPGCNNSQGATTPYKDFGPRIGFAYSPQLGFLSGGNSHKFSILGGYGIYYNRTEEEGSLQNLSQAPFGITSAGARDSFTGTKDKPAFGNPFLDINTGATVRNPFPASFPKPGDPNAKFPGNPLFLSQYSPGYKVPYAENFQLSVQREFPGQSVFIASYVGSVGRHNQQTIEGNPITQAGHDACLADPVCIANQSNQEILYPSHTLYPQPINPKTNATHFHSASQIQTEGSSNYNALELSLKKGSTHGLAAQISYTYSHALDTVSSYEGGGFGGERGFNQYVPSLNYGNSDFDSRHRLVIAPIYVVPTHGGNQLSFRNLLTSGWEVSAITTFATGHPFDISYQGLESYSLYCSSNDFYYTCPDVPNQVAPLQRRNPHSVAPGSVKGQFFVGDINTPTASFADEVTGSFGNIGRNKYTAPGIDNTNAQVSKNFAYSKDDPSRTVQLRIESYNVFNHTNFNSPNGNPDNGPGIFGVIRSAQPGRQFQLSGKIFF